MPQSREPGSIVLIGRFLRNEGQKAASSIRLPDRLQPLQARLPATILKVYRILRLSAKVLQAEGGSLSLREPRTEEARFGVHGGLLKWGSHVCCLYSGAAQRDEILLGFFSEGSRSGDLLAYGSAEGQLRDLPSRLAASAPGPIHLLRRDPRELCCAGGRIPPWIARDRPEGPSQGFLLEEGRRVRSAVDMSWAVEEAIGAGALAEAEVELDQAVRERPWIALCMYDLELFSNSNIVLALRFHPFVVGRQGLMPNAFYERLSRLKGDFRPGRGKVPKEAEPGGEERWSYGA